MVHGTVHDFPGAVDEILYSIRLEMAREKLPADEYSDPQVLHWKLCRVGVHPTAVVVFNGAHGFPKWRVGIILLIQLLQDMLKRTGPQEGVPDWLVCL